MDQNRFHKHRHNSIVLEKALTLVAVVSMHLERVILDIGFNLILTPPAKMNRSDLVEKMASKFVHLPYQDVELALDTLLAAITGALVRGGRVEIRGFGSMSVSHQDARIGRNPRNGQKVDIPAKRVIRFKPGKALRENVNIDLYRVSL